MLEIEYSASRALARRASVLRAFRILQKKNSFFFLSCSEGSLRTELLSFGGDNRYIGFYKEISVSSTMMSSMCCPVIQMEIVVDACWKQEQ